MTISAQVICDSISPNNHRLITIETHAPKFLDAELRTHRMFSQNSSSDRAIPISATPEMFIPNDVRKAGKGMQNPEQIDNDLLEQFQHDLVVHYQTAIDLAMKYKPTIHKQHLNRLFLPFSYQDKVITGNFEWFMYFLKLRNHPAADPAMQELASCISSAIQNSIPNRLTYYEWHLPYIRPEEVDYELPVMSAWASAARCARVSFLKHGSTVADINADLERAKQLLLDNHLTPFEHQAKVPDPMNNPQDNPRLSGNLTGWIQFRQYMEKNRRPI